MKSNDLFSMFLEVVGYLVLCGSAGYLIVHLMFWIDGVVNWAVARWWKRKRGETQTPAATETSVKSDVSSKAGQPTTDGKGGEL